MIHFCLSLRNCSDEEREKIIIAGAFHDIGIWINDTVDYIPPSLPPAMEYLKKRNLKAWSDEIKLIITYHHKIREYKDPDYPLVEVFRKGDMVMIFFVLGLFIDRIRSGCVNDGLKAHLLRKLHKVRVVFNQVAVIIILGYRLFQKRQAGIGLTF